MIETYLNQFAVIKSRTGFDLEGKPVISAGTTIGVRFQNITKTIRNDAGMEYAIDAEVWTRADQTVELEDVIVYGGSNYKVVKVEIKRDLSGNISHKKALLTKTNE